MDQLAAIEDLRRAAAILAESGDAASRRVAAGLRDYLDNAAMGIGLETSLGLARMPGQSAWWTVEAIDRRNAALRDLDARHFSDKRPASAAYEIHKLAARYAVSAWLIDRTHQEMPVGYAGTAKEFLWRAFKSDEDMPIAKRTIERILSESRLSNAA